MLPVTTTFIKARKWPLWIVYLLLGFPFILSLFIDKDSVRKDRNFYVIAILVSHLLFLFFWYLIERLEIYIYHDTLLYKNAFKSKELKWKVIVLSELSFEPSPHGGSVLWLFRSSEKKLVIAPSYFSRNNNRLLSEAVIAKCKEAEISDNIRHMANGKFPWYVF